MSEFGSIQNAGAKPEASSHPNNESLAQFGVASPGQEGSANFDPTAAAKPDAVAPAANPAG
eukprot:CAMPEP_0185596964 /NCGR_PEP_ID=MMETSP0434-20130131/81065_1 /TAXON_ID=626734 ORGANISM="Favella taraikaensis, Strain Fe Narragansett Bay" /NCGR_SAMPLE_ID=MMETSP0434 /ASSEMBLY_ACC=CAM_ASM_000379 /LENGTH=60 /DNA_ID=CAMNT_0028225559 /DNA_START=36 /DNA_END=218 /DNA_ORIENTATION=-